MSYVYIIGREQGPCKFGLSNDPAARARALQTGCPFPLMVLHSVRFPNRAQAEQAEQVFLRSWLDRHIHGEWFDVSAAEARGVLNDIAEGG